MPSKFVLISVIILSEQGFLTMDELLFIIAGGTEEAWRALGAVAGDAWGSSKFLDNVGEKARGASSLLDVVAEGTGSA